MYLFRGSLVIVIDRLGLCLLFADKIADLMLLLREYESGGIKEISV